MSYSQMVRGWYARSVSTVRPWYVRALHTGRAWSSRALHAARHLYFRSLGLMRALYTRVVETIRRPAAPRPESKPLPLPKPAALHTLPEHKVTVEHRPAERQRDNVRKPLPDAPKPRARRSSTKAAVK